MPYLLAGDVGGTKTILALYATDASSSRQTKPLREIAKTSFKSADYSDFNDLLQDFLSTLTIDQEINACFGIAGPIIEQICDATNLPWSIDALKIKNKFGFSKIKLINDLEAAAYGMTQLNSDDFVELNPDAKPQKGHCAVVAAGTGLGEAIMAWSGEQYNGEQYIVLPSEGGHCEFGANDQQEDELLKFLRQRFNGHVSIERILSGDGFANIYDFLRDSNFADSNPEIEQKMQVADKNAIISQHGLSGDDLLCQETLRLFVKIYGREAGNLCLKCLPKAGIYIGGGIAPKIIKQMQSGEFMAGFLDKGRMTHAIKNIPVRLVLNTEAPLIGAAYIANN